MGLRLRTLDRTRLARSAFRFASHGWHVVPGAAFTGKRFRCDDAGCPTVGCHPVTVDWQALATDDPADVLGWWRHTPYAVLLPTGRAFDVLEVPAALGRAALAHRSVHSGLCPVAVTTAGRYMFLVRPGDGLRPELDERLDVLVHGLGSWVPAPPTRESGGRVRWEVTPNEVGWHLPRSYDVQERLVAALQPAGRPAPARNLHGVRVGSAPPRAA